jgi:hypothetical protein
MTRTTNRPNVHQVRTILARRDHRNTRVRTARGLDGKEHLFVDIRTTSKDTAADEIRAVLHTLQVVGLYVGANGGGYVDAVHGSDLAMVRARGFTLTVPPDWHGPRNWPAWLNTAREAGQARSWKDTLTVMYGG